MTNILLCGGSGTRLFPLSRASFPKQFIEMFPSESEPNRLESLFLQTFLRNEKICSNMLVVSNVEQYFLAQSQLENCNKKANYLLESIAKNTAAAVLLSALSLDKNEIVLVTPSDHLIKDEEEYFKCVLKAQELAKGGDLVTFGIKPNFAHTGFGYIQADGFNVVCFHEKPDFKTAQSYVESKNYLWNAGIFCFKVETLLQEAQIHAPTLLESCKNALKEAQIQENISRIPLKAMEKLESNSLDYAILEKSKRIKVVPSCFKWSDVGSFDALSSEFSKDENANVLMANAEVVESSGTFAFCENKRKVVALVGAKDLLIVDTPDVLLVAQKGHSQKIKNIVEKLQSKNEHTKEICKNHITTHRPWGSYTILEDEMGYKIKRIVVNPGKRLSLQKHFHRNEHWIVVSGTASVLVNGKEMLIRPNESTYIKMGETHRLSNEGKIPVVLIEAQVGEYTKEDDIIRIDDDFGRGC